MLCKPWAILLVNLGLTGRTLYVKHCQTASLCYSSPEPIKVWVSNAHAKISIGTQALRWPFIIISACYNFRMMALDLCQCLSILKGSVYDAVIIDIAALVEPVQSFDHARIQ